MEKKARGGSWAIDGALRWVGARYLLVTGRTEHNRREVHGGAAGLRIACFHETPPEQFDRFRRVVDWARERFDIATPEDADALFAGRWKSERDQLLFTCDDGMGSNHAAAEYLASVGIRAIFFVIPSLVDRTLGQFVEHHARSGVVAIPPRRNEPSLPGLTRSQIDEMVSMGHRIGAHNYAHRDLGKLHDEASLRFEIDRAIDSISEITGEPCEDFAIGYGQPENVTDEAALRLREKVPHVYMCHRGLNAPGQAPRFLLRYAFELDHPFLFTCAAIEGAADHLIAGRAREMVRRLGTVPAADAASTPDYGVSPTPSTATISR